MKKKLCALFLGYLAGNIVNSVFNKKNSSELKSEANICIENGKCGNKVFFDNFIETQINFLNTLKTKLFTNENKTFFEEKKEEVIKVIDEYKEKGEKLFADLKSKADSYIKDIKQDSEEK